MSILIVLLVVLISASHGNKCPVSSLHRKNVVWMDKQLMWRNKVITWMESVEKQCDLQVNWRQAFPCPDFSEVRCRNASMRQERKDLSNCTIVSCANGQYRDNGVLEKIWQHDINAHENIISIYEEVWKDCMLRARSDRECSEYEIQGETTVPDTQITAIPTLESITYPIDEDGWTVIQRRLDGSVNFQRNWTEYVTGFGDPEGEFWIGLESIHQLTKMEDKILRIDMIANGTNEQAYAEYSNFWIEDASQNYSIEIYGYSGNATNAFRVHYHMDFTTYDVDNDEHDDNCANISYGGWWYTGENLFYYYPQPTTLEGGIFNCHATNLNGLYGEADPQKGVVWYNWEKRTFSFMKFTEMKIRDKTTALHEDIRLVGGNATAGLVEIRYEGEWGTICDTNWDWKGAARVICRMLGFSDLVAALGDAHFGPGIGYIVMDEVFCWGHETSIWNCNRRKYVSHTCSHENDASVICKP